VGVVIELVVVLDSREAVAEGAVVVVVGEVDVEVLAELLVEVVDVVVAVV
jgi:hypothetical protein